MGCVSSKSFRRGPDRGSWYSPMSGNVSAFAANQCLSGEGFGEDDNGIALQDSPYYVLDERACHGSSFNFRNHIKHSKGLLSDTDVEESFTFTSNLDVHCERTCGREPGISEFEFDKVVAVQRSKELDVEKKQYLLCDYLNMQHMVVHKRSKRSLWGDERRALLDKNVREINNVSSLGTEHILQENGTKMNFTVSDSWDANRMVKHAGTMGNPDDDSRQRLISITGSDTEIIDAKELMEGLEDSSKTPSPLSSRTPSTLSIPERQISFSIFPAISGATTAAGEIGSPVWKKYYMQDSLAVGLNTWNMHSPAGGSPFNESPRRALSQSSFTDVDDIRSVSSMDGAVANAIGLKILLSPPSSAFHPSPVNRALPAVANSDKNCDGSSTPDGINGDNAKSPYRSRKPSMESISCAIGLEHIGSDLREPLRSLNLTRSNSSVYDSGSPLFDPSLMATFEQALKVSTAVTTYDDWLHFSTDESLTLSSSSANTLESVGDESIDVVSAQSKQIIGVSMWPSNQHQIKKAVLESYDCRCPPRGEGKVVLYFTSLRGVRRTYESCFDVRLILRGLGVIVDERDVWMHSEFRKELSEVLDGLSKGVPQVPQLFIKGRYIGGAEVVKQLHEEGLLACLMEGLAMGLIHSICDGCGDARFVPCFTCNGSRKVIDMVNEVSQCLVCNENGLIMCPICNT